MGGGRRKEWRRNVFIDLGTSRQQPHSVEMKFYQIIHMALHIMQLLVNTGKRNFNSTPQSTKVSRCLIHLNIYEGDLQT